MRDLRTRRTAAPHRHRELGFSLVELLVTMAITTMILGATMAAMNNAITATDSAAQITNLNNGLRTAMDLIVRDLLQVGQGLPGTRAIVLPNGANSVPMLLPGPEGNTLELDGPSYCPPRATDPDTVCEEMTAVTPGPGRGPELVEGVPTDMITTLAADSSFEAIPLRAFANDGRSITVPRPGATVLGATDPRHPNGHIISDVPDVDGDNIRPGDLIMLTKGSLSALVQVSSVTAAGVSPQVVNFAANDSLQLNQAPPVADGTAGELRNSPPIDTVVAPVQFVTTVATKIRMITYYIDNVTDPVRPRLVRRLNNGSWDTFNNADGTAVAFDIEGLTISYDLADGVNNPSNVRMDDADLAGTGRCSPEPCFPNQIRKINIMLSARSRFPRRGTQQFFRNRLVTQVSLRSLAFVDQYR